jgi:hypothetical protein
MEVRYLQFKDKQDLLQLRQTRALAKEKATSLNDLERVPAGQSH